MPEVHRLTLPTPFPVGPVNAYVLRGDPPAVVDPGPLYPPARDALVQGLRVLDLGLSDIELILITHPHIDHYGLAGEVAAAAGARVAAFAGAASRLGVPLHQGQAGEREALEELLVRADAPDGFNEALFELWSLADTLASPVTADVLLGDGDVIKGGGVTWRVVHTPGHSPGAACFHDEAGGRLLSGDTLLPHISSNAIVEFRPGGPTGLVRERSLERYLASLHRISALEVGEVLPGHGRPFKGHREVVAGRMRHYEARKATLVGLLERLGPSPAFRIAMSLFPDQQAAMGQFLALSEVIGHLDLLEAEGRVHRHENGTVDLYSLT